MRALRCFTLLAFAVVAGCHPVDQDDAQVEADLVGGRGDLRWSASGYLARGESMDSLDRSKPACGATLIAPNAVVTAAHCVLDERATFAFGAGDTRTGPVVRVVERHVHPSFHAEANGAVDLVHALRKYDVAVLILERNVDFAAPAELPEEAPSTGCSIQAIGYRDGVRASTPACVMFRITLGRDPIFEVHPQEDSALCVADGDEGSAVVARDPNRTTVVGIYVGSVTQRITDCRRGTQFLNGYESMFGYRDFIRDTVTRARSGS